MSDTTIDSDGEMTCVVVRYDPADGGKVTMELVGEGWALHASLGPTGDTALFFDDGVGEPVPGVLMSPEKLEAHARALLRQAEEGKRRRAAGSH